MLGLDNGPQWPVGGRSVVWEWVTLASASPEKTLATTVNMDSIRKHDRVFFFAPCAKILNAVNRVMASETGVRDVSSSRVLSPSGPHVPTRTTAVCNYCQIFISFLTTATW